MKKQSIFAVTAALAALAAPAVAAAKETEDSSYFVIWAFLSFCALIIVGQLIPVIGNLLDARKAAKKKAEELETVTQKTH